MDAIIEAIAHGSIDGKMKSLNDNKFMQRFTTHRRNSAWFSSNRKRVERLISYGRMTVAGLKTVEESKQNRYWDKVHLSS